MKGARLHRWGGEISLEEIPEPAVGDGEVLVEVDACGVGLTVLNCMRGELGSDPANLPRVPGHEVIGRVVSVGPGVDQRRVGEHVAAFFYLYCARCAECLAGRENLCRRMNGFIGVNRDGGYAERVSLPAHNAITLPRGVDAVEATVINDAVASPVHVVNVSHIGPGQRVAVIGAGGGLGVHMVQVARVHGAEVVGLDVAADKLAFLEHQLRTAAVDSSDFARVNLPSAWDGQADVVVDFVGRSESLRWGVSVLAPGGRLVTVTTFHEAQVAVLPRVLVLSQLSILGSRYCTRAEFDAAARLVATGQVRPVIGRREPIGRVSEVHDDLRHGRLLGRGALVWR